MGFGSAIRGGKLRHISASQGGNYEACPRMWYEDKVGKRPSIQDWSFAQMGVAIHQVLDQQVSTYLGKEPKEDERLLSSAVLEEAEEFVDRFDWERYFLGHEMIDSEMEMLVPLGDELPDVALAIDVLSRDADGTLVATDWKSGYGADKGVDIQTQIYSWALMRVFDVEFVKFRRIYPRLPGEEKGWKKVEEYAVSQKDAARFERRIRLLAKQMSKTAEGEIEPRTQPSDRCVWCSIAHDCPATKGEAITLPEMVNKLKAHKAAVAQIEAALKKAALEGDLIAGDEVYGYVISETWSVPRKVGLKKAGEALFSADPELFAKHASIKIDDEVASKLKEIGLDVNVQTRRSFKLKNEKELKEKSKSAKKSETTSGGA